MKPFLFLGIRADDAAADGELDAFVSAAGLARDDVRRVRLEREALGEELGQEFEQFLAGLDEDPPRD